MNDVIDAKKADDGDAGKTVIVDGASVDEISEKLKALGVEDAVIAKIKTELGATNVDDLSGLTEKDLLDSGMKPLPARNLLKKLAPVSVVTPVVGINATPRAEYSPAANLQSPPMSASDWLSNLSSIRPQIIQPLTVLVGVNAITANAFGYFNLPKKMMDMLRDAADAVGEGVPDLFFELQNIRHARRYGALVSWMTGKGSACTIAERKRFLKRMGDRFWLALDAFYSVLDVWRQGRRDSMDVGEQMANAFSGEYQIYDATPVRSAALALGDSINHIFSGTGVYSATALALDHDKIKETLTQVDFRLFGAQSREKLLADLECAVPPEIEAAGNATVNFVWNAMAIREKSAGGRDEQKFLIDLAAIGAGRPWNLIKELAAKRKDYGMDDVEPEDDDDFNGLTGIGGKSSGRRNK